MTADLLAQIIIGGGSVLVAVLLVWKADDLGGDERHRIDRIEDARDEARWWLVRLERGWE